MSCASGVSIDRYLDGELPEGEARELEAHLRTCAACSSQALAHSQLKRRVHVAGKVFAPDPQFRSRIQARIRKQEPARWRWSWTLALAAGCAGMVLAVAASLLWVRQSQHQQVLSELADLHVATLASANRVDVVSSDRHTVKPWFQGKVPFTFNLPELAGSPFELIGGRLTYLEQNPGAELLFGVRKHVLSVFIFKDSPELDRAFRSGELAHKLSFNVESWTQGCLRYVIVSDASSADVSDLRQRLMAVAQ